MIHITKTQQGILTKFIAYAKKRLEPPIRRPTAESSEPEHLIIDESFDWFKRNSDERISNIEDRIEKLKELRETAMNTATSVSIIIQQQSSLI